MCAMAKSKSKGAARRRPAVVLERLQEVEEEARVKMRTPGRGLDGPGGRMVAGLDYQLWMDWSPADEDVKEWFGARGRCQRAMGAGRMTEEDVGSP